MAKPQKNQQKKQQPKGSHQGIDTTNFFDSAVFEYVEDVSWPKRGLSDGRWMINGKDITSVLTEVILSSEAWTIRKERAGGVFSAYGVERHFRLAIQSERHWCKDFVVAALRGLVTYISSAIHCSTVRNTPGNEKEKYKAADAASAAFEERFA